MRFGRSIAAAVLIPVVVVGAAFAQTSDTTKPAPSSAAPAVAAPASAASAAPAVAPPASAAAPASTAAGADGATYAIRLRELERNIEELKEQIRRSHTRLSLLSDTILGGGVAGSRAEISFQNEMSGAFRLTRAIFILDGAVQYNKADESGVLAEQAMLPIYTGAIPAGDHTLQVFLQLQGNGYGVFSYLRGYRFEVRSTHSFTAAEGKTTNIQAIAYEKGGVTTPLEERPAIRYVEKNAPLRTDQASQPASAAPAPAVSAGFSIGGK